jgi:hypothetical protein
VQRGPVIGGTQILQMVTIVLGVGCSMAFGFFLMSFVHRRLVPYLAHKFGVTITVTSFRSSSYPVSWTVEGGPPLKRFGIGLLYWPCYLGVAAGAIVPFVLLYALAERI